MGYKFQFITLAGFHNLNYHMFELASDYQRRDMSAYADLQDCEFEMEAQGYTATKHQREVGTGYLTLFLKLLHLGIRLHWPWLVQQKKSNLKCLHLFRSIKLKCDILSA